MRLLALTKGVRQSGGRGREGEAKDTKHTLTDPTLTLTLTHTTPTHHGAQESHAERTQRK